MVLEGESFGCREGSILESEGGKKANKKRDNLQGRSHNVWLMFFIEKLVLRRDIQNFPGRKIVKVRIMISF